MRVSDESAAEYPNNYNFKGKKSSVALKEFISKNKAFPDYIPDLSQEIYDDPEFNKINDFIFGPIEQFCVSQKVKDILLRFNLPDHRFYPVKVFLPKRLLGFIKIRRKLNKPYYAFNFDFKNIANNEHWIDFSKTKFEKHAYSIDKTDHIFFNENFDFNLDIFEIKYSWMTYISEALRDEFLKEEVTGISFSDIAELQWKVPRPNPKISWK